MPVGRLFSFWNGPFSGDMLIFGGCVYAMGTTHESGTATLSWRYLIQGKACPNCLDTTYTSHLEDGLPVYFQWLGWASPFISHEIWPFGRERCPTHDCRWSPEDVAQQAAQKARERKAQRADDDGGWGYVKKWPLQILMDFLPLTTCQGKTCLYQKITHELFPVSMLGKVFFLKLWKGCKSVVF